MGIIISVITVLFLILCVLLVILILLQSDKSAGMGILGGSSQSAFGSSTADVISKATGVMIGLFMLGSLGLAALESSRTDSLKQELLKSEETSNRLPMGQDNKNKNEADKTGQKLPVK
jgi:preprotein translocase subunit SecG